MLYGDYMIKRIFIGIAFICLTACETFTPLKHDIQFENIPCIRPNKAYNYLTCESVTVNVDGRKVVIPKNFNTDLASIPRWYWTVLSPAYSGLIAPSILHDYLYSCHLNFDRIEADEILYYSLLSNGVSKFTAYKMYIVVRLFGNPHYHKELACNYSVGF